VSFAWDKVPTTVEVYRLLLTTHQHQLSVFETDSDPEGYYTGRRQGQMMTVWGLKGADAPLFGAESKWDILRTQPGDASWPVQGRINEKHEYWLCKPLEVHDE